MFCDDDNKISADRLFISRDGKSLTDFFGKIICEWSTDSLNNSCLKFYVHSLSGILELKRDQLADLVMFIQAGRPKQYKINKVIDFKPVRVIGPNNEVVNLTDDDLKEVNSEK